MNWIDRQGFSISGDYKIVYNERSDNFTVTYKGKELGWYWYLESAKFHALDHKLENSISRKFTILLVGVCVVPILLHML